MTLKSKAFSSHFLWRFIIFAAVTFLFLTGCSDTDTYEYQAQNGKEYETKMKLDYVKSIEFEIDSLFNISSLYHIGAFQEETQKKVYFLTDGRLYFYNYDSKDLVKAVSLETEGPNTTGPYSFFDGVAMNSMDTIYFLNHSTGILYCLNNKAEVVSKMELNEFQENSAFFGSTMHPLQLINEKLFIPAYGFKNSTDFSSVFTSLVYPLKSKSPVGVFYYPELYNKAYWGYHTFMRWASCNYSPESNLYYVSYAIDPNIYIYDEGFDFVRKKYLSSEYFNAILPQSEDPDRRLLNEGRTASGADEYFLSTPFFFGGLYHEEAGLYIRMARIGKNESLGIEKVRFSLIFADDQLNKVGEYLIPEKYSYSAIFPTSKGLAFFNVEKYNRKEDKVFFDILNFTSGKEKQ